MKYKKKMKICFFCGDITRRGGVEKVVCELCSELSKKKEMDVQILSLGNSFTRIFFELSKHVRVDIVSKDTEIKKKSMLSNMFTIFKYLRRNSIDILINVDVMLGMYTLPLKPFLKTKIIAWEHFGFHSDIGSKHTDMLRRVSVKYCDYFINLTQKDLLDFKEHYEVKCPIKAIYNPFCVASDIVKYNLKSKIIISIGNFYDVKGFDMIIPIGKQVFTKYPEWKWIVLGDGEKYEQIKQEILKEKLEEKILLLGRVKNVQEFLEKSAIFALTSRQESFGLVLLEAQSAKLPVVAFDVPQGPAEIIKNGYNGFLIKAFDLVEYGEKLCELIENTRLRNEFSECSKENLVRFDINIIAQEWINVFEELVDGRK